MEKNNMYENFDMLVDRVIDTLDKTDLLEVKQKLESIKTPTIVSGVGGSFVVSNYTSKILSEKNNIVAINIEPRDISYMNISNYENILSVSFSGNNYGVETIFNNHLNHYLLSNNIVHDVVNINYKNSIEKENSFISLAGTLMPMSILLSYYLDNDVSIIEEILSMTIDKVILNSNLYEIISGVESSTASLYLDSTLSEAGIGIPIIHSKYDFCHGRSTLGKYYDSEVILLNKNNELDDTIFNSLINVGKKVYTIDKKYEDDLINDFYLTYMCMQLSKFIAESKNMDLSIVNYSPVVKKLYKYKGVM